MIIGLLLLYIVLVIGIHNHIEEKSISTLVYINRKKLKIDPTVAHAKFPKSTQAKGSLLSSYALDAALSFLLCIFLGFGFALLLTTFKHPPSVPDPVQKHWRTTQPNDHLLKYVRENKETLQVWGFSEFVTKIEQKRRDKYKVYTSSSTLSLYTELFIDLFTTIAVYCFIVTTLTSLIFLFIRYKFIFFLSWLCRLYFKPFLNSQAFSYSSSKQLEKVKNNTTNPLSKEKELFFVTNYPSKGSNHYIQYQNCEIKFTSKRWEQIAVGIQCYRLGYKDQLVLLLTEVGYEHTNPVFTVLETLKTLNYIINYFTLSQIGITPFGYYNNPTELQACINGSLFPLNTDVLPESNLKVYLPLGKYSETAYYVIDVESLLQFSDQEPLGPFSSYTELLTLINSPNHWVNILHDMSLLDKVVVRDISLGLTPVYLKDAHSRAQPKKQLDYVYELVRSKSEV